MFHFVHQMCQSIVNFLRIFHILYTWKIKEESIIFIEKQHTTMNEQIRKSTNRGLEALLKLVLGEITIEQAEQIINTMNDQEPNHRGDLSL